MPSSSYPKILHVGDKAIADLFDGQVEITEKLDGSQFGFGNWGGSLVVRSKGKELDLDDPDKMFIDGVEYIKSIQDKLPKDTFFYGEYLQKPRHSTLAYDRIPKNHIALFGVLKIDRSMGSYEDIKKWADKLDVSPIPLLFEGESGPDHVIDLVKNTESYLGGQKVEGVVVKRYEDWMFLGRILTPVKAGKYVSEQFKEVHKKDWSKLNTGKGKFEALKDKYRSEARWNKAIMHLKERGEFEGTVRDIGNLIKEIQKDVTEEEKENMKEELWNIFSGDVLRFTTHGFVDWYKEKIARGEFQE